MHWKIYKTVGVFVSILVIVAIFWYLFTNVLKKSPAGPNNDTLHDVTVRLPIPVVDMAFAPFYMGIDTGIFERYGLRVILEPGSPELNPVRMVEQGTDEFGVVGGPELLFSGRGSGAKVRGIALLHKDSDFVVLLTQKTAEIQEVQDLQGKEVGFFYGHISTDILRMLFKKEDIDVVEVDRGFDYSQFITGRLSAQWAFRTTAGLTLPARGIEMTVISPASYGIRTHGHTVITSERFIQNDPFIVQSFVSALIEATEYTLQNKDEAIASAIRRDPTFDKNVAEKQFDIYAETIRNNSRIGWIDIDAMRRSAEQMKEINILNESSDVEKAFDRTFLRDHYEE